MDADDGTRLDDDFSPREDEPIARADTALRALSTLVMAVVWSLVETVLAVVVVFSIVWTFVVQQPPPHRLRELSNRLVCYAYRLWRYMTYNESTVPFPFSDFPEEIEPPRALERDEARELRELVPPLRRDDGES